MQYITPIDMKVIDTNTASQGLPTICLMEIAGTKIKQLVDTYENINHVTICTGNGGNAGDGYVTARHIINDTNKNVHIIQLKDPNTIKNQDTKQNWKLINEIEKTSSKLKITKITDTTQLEKIETDLIIDTIFSTGIKGKIREPISQIIDNINQTNIPVISIDVPTGINPLTGQIDHKAIKADITVTIHKPKIGLKTAPPEYIGKIHNITIGIPKTSERYTNKGDLLRIHKPSLNSHKGENGKISIIGGNKDYAGALFYAAKAAQKQAIDLTFIYTPEKTAQILKQQTPENIITPLPGTVLSSKHYQQIEEKIEQTDAILIGSGSGLKNTTKELFDKILKNTTKPVLIDADALKLINKSYLNKNMVVTPHTKEYEILFNTKLPESHQDRIKNVQENAKKYNTTIVLKGSIDIIATHNQIKENKTGNPQMSKGGTGDMLAGIITALISRKHSIYEASYLGTYLLGIAGENALKKQGYNYTQQDIINQL
ncbi:MAG: NAD(P)H-hydrate dehydratase [Methanobacteriaceae archaeon]|nr:NAD(P)H-hydrate dehydratase [Methanobacteriaceae archaeon]